MSVVLAYANENKAIISGDTRVTNDLTKEILSETYEKVRKLSDSVIVGFSGAAIPCQHIAQSLISIDDLSNCYAEDIVEHIENMISIYSKEQRFQFTIGGIGRKGKICTAIMSSYDKTKIFYPTNSAPFCCQFYPREVPRNLTLYKRLLLSKAPEEAMKDMILYCSYVSPSVNQIMVLEKIELCQ